jgi:hypothetical protein
MRVGAISEPRGGTLGTVEQQSDAAFTMVRRIAVLRRQNIHTATVRPEKSLIGAASAPPPNHLFDCASLSQGVFRASRF